MITSITGISLRLHITYLRALLASSNHALDSQQSIIRNFRSETVYFVSLTPDERNK